MDYGFSGLYRAQSTGVSNNSNGLSNQALNAVANLITIERVVDIILDNTHPDFETVGGWSSIGYIKTSKTGKFVAPLNTNIKNYPLKNEMVLIINKSALSSVNTITNASDIPIVDVSDSYYLNILGVWGSHHHNAYPFTGTEEEQIEAYVQSSLEARFNPVFGKVSEVPLGKSFAEKENIPPLLPFEGDIIVEGRWGNSIRLGSTTRYNDTPEGIYYKSLEGNDFLNNWSAGLSPNGDPIILIKNSRPPAIKYKPYDPTTEDIDVPSGNTPIEENIVSDDSSLYLTSTQLINTLPRAYMGYVSYEGSPNPLPPIEQNLYDNPQIILNSGRLVFNATQDHILLNSFNSINLNAFNSVNIDTKSLCVQSNKIFLGNPALATEPLLLGNVTVDLLRNLISSIKLLSSTLQNLQSDNVAPNAPATFKDLLIPMASIATQMDSLLSQLGSSPETCTLTSKNNFTV